jgi:cytochrome c553
MPSLFAKLVWFTAISTGVLGLSALAQTQAPARPKLGDATPAIKAQPTTAATKPVVDYGQRFAQQCVACHGADGKGAIGLAPSLAGQHSFYAITQLFLFKNGRRDNAAMTVLVKDFSNDDLRGFSEVIGKLPALAIDKSETSIDGKKLQLGKELSSKHNCVSCHGSDLAGGQQVPRLAGQHEDYLVRVLEQFRNGQRLGYTPAMNEALAGLTPEELAALAYYLSKFPELAKQ